LTNQGGTLAPGLSAGRTTIDGNYTQQAGGTLDIEIGGATQSTQYDFVSSEGFASLNGQLQLSLINGFVPTGAQMFTILDTVGGIGGAFSNVASGQRLTTTDGNGSFQVNYGAGSAFDPNSVVLSAFMVVPLPGDYNHNGVVDGADYVVWRNTLGQTGGGLAADGNGNNQVDSGDFNIWRAHFGQTAGSGSGEAGLAVPEPAIATVVLAGVVAVIGQRIRWAAA
jgi:hypothetical protein